MNTEKLRADVAIVIEGMQDDVEWTEDKLLRYQKAIEDLVSHAQSTLQAIEKGVPEFIPRFKNYTDIEKVYASCKHKERNEIHSECIHCEFDVLISRARYLEKIITDMLPLIVQRDFEIKRLREALNSAHMFLRAIHPDEPENLPMARQIGKEIARIMEALNEGGK